MVSHHGRLLALLEAAHPTELAADLSTIGEYDFGGALHGAFTAHPKIDPITGEMLAFGYQPFPPYLRYHAVTAEGTLRSVDLDTDRATMMHDFVVTETNAVFFDLPALFDLEAMMSGRPGIRWAPEAGARIGVLPRDGDRAVWIEVEPFYVFHFLNAWDLPDGRIVVVGCRTPRLNTSFDPDEVLPDDARPSLHRWTIDPAAGTVTDEPLDDRPADFPRIDDRRAGHVSRYGYLAATPEWDPNGDVVFDSVLRYDLSTGDAVAYCYGPSHRCGEPVFCPDPAGRDEEDGWIVNFVTDLSTDSTRFVVLAASDLTAGPVCEVELPRRVPAGFHGNWVPGLAPKEVRR